jgi:hypothetical protein
MQCPSSCSATDSKSNWLLGMLLAAPKTRLGEAATRAFHVATMFWTGTTMSAALAEAGSMQTDTLSVPPLPV